MNTKMNEIITYKELVSQIFFIRGKRVILDFHLATLYEVETRSLKQQVKRNVDRFPDDFMFILTKSEWNELITNCDNLKSVKFSPSLPFAFTEQGVSMLSSVLRSKKAIEVSIGIMRAFVRMRELLDESKELRKKLDSMEKKFDGQFKLVFDAIRRIIIEKDKPKNPIGFQIK
jgi:hypothetical protein